MGGRLADVLRGGLYAWIFGLILAIAGWSSAGSAGPVMPVAGGAAPLTQEMTTQPRMMVPDATLVVVSKVPELRKRDVEEAAAVLLKAGLQLGKVTTLSANAPAGTVLRQSPAAGQIAKKGSRVDVWIAAAPPATSSTALRVPNLLKRQVEDAEAILAESGLELGNVTTLSFDAPAGTVLRQSPAAGQIAKKGSRVDVWIAAAPPATSSTALRVPNLLKRQVEDAEAILAESGLELGNVTTLSFDAPAGTVLRQSPAAGDPAGQGARVDVWIAAAPPITPSNRVKVPDLIKRQVKEAAEILSESRLQLGAVAPVSSNAPEGTVLRQSPAAGQSAEPGLRVDVWVAAVPPVKVPELRQRAVREARAMLSESGLQLGAVEPIAAQAPEGTVVRQDPVAGRTVKRGSAVRVWIAEALAVTVPDLRGLPVEEAGERLRASRLGLGVQTPRPSLPPAGEVMEQKPAAGAEVELGAGVDVTVGDGSQAQVPGIVGDTEGTALERLDVAGLRPGERRTEESEAPEGEILRQQPAGGNVVGRGSAVAYWVAVSPQVIVPDIIGLRADQAMARLEPLGLAGGQVGAEESDRPQDEILRQAPAPGARVPRGSRVEFWVASPVLIPVPELSGLRMDDARARLAQRGLVMAARPVQESDAPKHIVIGQKPAAGTPVPRGAEVAVRVSAGRSLVQPWVIGGGIGAAVLVAGAGLWMARRRLRPPKPPGPVTPTVRVRMKEPDAFVADALGLDPKAPTVQLRTRLVPGGSKVFADKLLVGEERRES